MKSQVALLYLILCITSTGYHVREARLWMRGGCDGRAEGGCDGTAEGGCDGRAEGGVVWWILIVH